MSDDEYDGLAEANHPCNAGPTIPRKPMSEQPITAELDLALAKDAIARLNAIPDMSCMAEASGIQSVIDALTAAQARVTELEAQLAKALEDGNADSNELWNPAHDSAIARAALELAAGFSDEEDGGWSQYHIDNWQDSDYASHIVAVKQGLAKMVKMRDAIRSISIPAIMARAKETDK